MTATRRDRLATMHEDAPIDQAAKLDHCDRLIADLARCIRDAAQTADYRPELLADTYRRETGRDLIHDVMDLVEAIGDTEQ